MKKIFFLVFGIVFLTELSGCAVHQLKAPCPEYGKWCQKIPVNSWDDQN